MHELETQQKVVIDKEVSLPSPNRNEPLLKHRTCITMIERNFTKLSERLGIMLNDELGTNHVHVIDITSKVQIWETVSITFRI